MSIKGELLHRQSEGRLFLLQPLVLGTAHRRFLYVTTLLRDQIDGPWRDSRQEERMGRLRADIDHFSSGGLVTVATGAERHAYIKRLDHADEEVWTIRSRDPRPSLRIFGRFAEADIFIATHLHERASLGAPGSRTWRDEFERCKAEWRKLFPTYEPKRGSTVNDYITTNVVALGALR